jgi:hypothetical protein
MVLRKLLIALSILIGLSSAAWALEDVLFLGLEPGARFVVEVDDAGEVTVTPDGTARLSDLDRDVLRQFADTYDDPEKLAEMIGPNAAIIRSDMAQPRPVEPGLVRISFFRMTGRNGLPETLLLLENGYDSGFRYRAQMVRGERTEPTDVCMVLPRLRGYEHWPYSIDRINLSEFALVPYRAGTAPACG